MQSVAVPLIGSPEILFWVLFSHAELRASAMPALMPQA